MGSEQITRFFLHMPKCGGTSVRTAIENLGSANLVRDYDSYFKIPMRQRAMVVAESGREPHVIPDNALVFGHFFPVKYKIFLSNNDCKLVTILRDPIDRLISHYRYWNSADFSD